jgi:hypothetical protein
MKFSSKTPEIKRFAEMLCEALLILKNISLSLPGFISVYKRGSFNPKAVRINIIL